MGQGDRASGFDSLLGRLMIAWIFVLNLESARSALKSELEQTYLWGVGVV